jgi:hypothetical protein
VEVTDGTRLPSDEAVIKFKEAVKEAVFRMTLEV